jgi:hypothetical protein
MAIKTLNNQPRQTEPRAASSYSTDGKLFGSVELTCTETKPAVVIHRQEREEVHPAQSNSK